jgi:hypothetical protein
MASARLSPLARGRILRNLIEGRSVVAAVGDTDIVTRSESGSVA